MYRKDTPLVYEVQFSEPVKAASVSTSQVTSFGTSQASFVVNGASLVAQASTLALSVSGVQDLAGNAMTSAQIAAVVVDGQAPTITSITTSTTNANPYQPIQYTVNFSEAIDRNTLSSADFANVLTTNQAAQVASLAIIGAQLNSDQSSAVVTIVPTSPGAIKLGVSTDVSFSDLAGNLSVLPLTTAQVAGLSTAQVTVPAGTIGLSFSNLDDTGSTNYPPVTNDKNFDFQLTGLPASTNGQPSLYITTAGPSAIDSAWSLVSNFTSQQVGVVTTQQAGFSINGLSDGSWSFKARVADNSGRTYDSNPLSVIIDTAAPTPTVTTTTAQNAWLSDAVLDMVEDSSDQTVTVGGLADGETFVVTVNGFNFPSTGTSQSVTLKSAFLESLADGKYQLYVTAVDRAGNVSDPTVIDFEANTNISLLSTTDFKALTTKDIAGLTTTQVQTIRTDQVQVFTSTQLPVLSTANVQALTTAQLIVLSDSQLRFLTTKQIASIENADVTALLTTQIAALTSLQIPALTTAQVQSLTVGQVQALTTVQVQAIEPGDIAALTTTQVQALSSSQLSALSEGPL
ncbi:MAG: hypothetical protein EB072_14325, partial [Betaproteobacteria bacterium]|nr:hypothetical protein [Betaproteobacteria bacterium]